MKHPEIDGIYLGRGKSYELLKNDINVVIVDLNLVLNIIKVDTNVYRVIELYTYINDFIYFGVQYYADSVYYESDYLIYRNEENQFTTSSDTGRGLEYFNFECDKLLFEYIFNDRSNFKINLGWINLFYVYLSF